MSDFEQIKPIFSEAIDKKGPDRESYLNQACGKDLNLKAKIQALLVAHEEAGDFLEATPFGPEITLDDSPLIVNPGAVIDRYKLLEKIGEGGMAVVYMAEQQTPIRRRVALKIIKLGMDTRSVIARFEAERQALAMMDHPNIAKVLDAGATEAGRPYFVMELVTGVSITDYCDANNLSTKERLKLFIEVCNAVQHAHQKGIIHRDIKPSNVMVTHQDGKPIPKVIDFGIAKAINQKLTEKTLFTRYAHIIGTPAYMSPEQAELSDLNIDTRTDIYSLGVLLYELLTGTPPFGEEELHNAGYLEMQRIIREQEPVRPSTKLSTLGGTLTDIAKHRNATPEVLAKSLRGDLDWIVMKCLEKDRTRRFETANGLVADIKRHIGNEPIVARPPSTVYRFQKAWCRNKVVYTAVVAVAIALLVGAAISVLQRIEAGKSEVNALRRAYNSDMSLAFRALEENLIGRVQDSVRQHIPELGEPDFRGWEWRYAWAQSQSDAVHIWDTPEEMGEVAAVRISPDQRYMVSSDFYYGSMFSYHTRRLWDFETREELKDVNLPGGSACGFAFSNSGKHLALHRGGGNAAHEVHIYDTDTWKLETRIPLKNAVSSLSFSPDDSTLVTMTSPDAILWDWRRCQIIDRWPVKNHWSSHVGFFPDGDRLAIGEPKELRIIDVDTNDVEHWQPAADDVITALAVSPDSRYVAIGCGYDDAEIRVLNTASGKQEPPLTGHSRSVTSLTFTADGKRLISSSSDNTIRVWDMDNRVTIRVLKGHESGVLSVSLASDGPRAISAGVDERILEWNLNAPLSPFRERTLGERVKQVIFSADSRSFYTINNEGSVSIWNVEKFRKQEQSSPALGSDSSIILSPDGNHVIAGTGSGELWALDAGDLREVAHEPNAAPGRILPVGFSADGKLLVALEDGLCISLWNTKTWELRSEEKTEPASVFLRKDYYVIPEDSNVLLYPTSKYTVWWDIEQSKELERIPINLKYSGIIAVSPTEPLLASSGKGDFIYLWNWQTRRFVDRLRGTKPFYGVAFSPDGRRLVTGSSGEGTLMLWDVSTRQEIAQLGISSTALGSVQFSPDGNIICAVDNRGTAYFLRAPTMEKINAVEATQRQIERR